MLRFLVAAHLAMNPFLAFILIIGGATLKDALEQIVCPVEDEFDSNPLEIKPDGPDKFIVAGGTAIAVVNRQLNLDLTRVGAETLTGFLMASTGEVLNAGDRIELDGKVAAVLEIIGSRASRIHMQLMVDLAR